MAQDTVDQFEYERAVDSSQIGGPEPALQATVKLLRGFQFAQDIPGDSTRVGLDRSLSSSPPYSGHGFQARDAILDGWVR